MTAFDEDRFRSALHSSRIRFVRELSKVTGISEQTLNIYSRGYLGNEETRAKIAAALGVEAAHIWRQVEVAP